jgi:toxin ParE1/3/4
MPRVIRTAQAEEDLIDIWVYIAEDNPDAADALLLDIDEKCELLAGNPAMGQARPDIASELRHFPVGRCLILYRIIDDGVEIVRVLHGARHLSLLF